MRTVLEQQVKLSAKLVNVVKENQIQNHHLLDQVNFFLIAYHYPINIKHKTQM